MSQWARARQTAQLKNGVFCQIGHRKLCSYFVAIVVVAVVYFCWWSRCHFINDVTRTRALFSIKIYLGEKYINSACNKRTISTYLGWLFERLPLAATSPLLRHALYLCILRWHWIRFKAGAWDQTDAHWRHPAETESLSHSSSARTDNKTIQTPNIPVQCMYDVPAMNWTWKCSNWKYPDPDPRTIAIVIIMTIYVRSERREEGGDVDEDFLLLL